MPFQNGVRFVTIKDDDTNLWSFYIPDFSYEDGEYKTEEKAINAAIAFINSNF